jgi:hypothetical protein
MAPQKGSGHERAHPRPPDSKPCIVNFPQGRRMVAANVLIQEPFLVTVHFGRSFDSPHPWPRLTPRGAGGLSLATN